MLPPELRTALNDGTIVDNYRITALLEMGDDSFIAYAGRDERLGRRVAITEIYPVDIAARGEDGRTITATSAENAEPLQRGIELFLRDARRLAQLSHPNVISLYGYAELNGTAYAFSELLLDASSIDDEVGRRGGRVSESDVITLGIAALEGLAAVHEAGVVHGNISPETIRLTQRGRVVLTDFIDARRAWIEASGRTKRFVAGRFRAPEQISDDARDPSIDLYSLAATLFWCATGDFPTSALKRVLESQPLQRPRESLSRLRPAFDEVLLRALNLQPSERFATARDFLAALKDVDRVSTYVTVSDRDVKPRDDAIFQYASSSRQALLELFAGIAPVADASIPISVPALAAVDDNVQFTVYRPAVVRPAEWNTLLAFAHLAEAREGSGDPDPVEQVERQAIQILESGRDDYGKVVQDSSQSVPREGTLTFVPHIDAVEFNPPQRSFQWVEDVHREEFRFRAAAALNGKVARGRMSVYHGAIILAEISLSIRIDAGFQSSSSAPAPEREHARPFRRIFASYSHQDLEIVRQFERFASTLGDRYLRDWNELRAGEMWNDRLMELIGEADVFQLFWSRNAMASPHVRREWEYALSLARPNFVRPTYWEDPLPESSGDGLPPDALKQLHFQKISLMSAEVSRHGDSRMSMRESPSRRPARPPRPPRDLPDAPPLFHDSVSPSSAPAIPPLSIAAPPSAAAAAENSRSARDERVAREVSNALSSVSTSFAPSSRSPIVGILTVVLAVMLISAIVFAIRTFF